MQNRLKIGDWLADVGFKAPNHVVWAWETIVDYSLEDVHSALMEASRLGKVVALRVIRYADGSSPPVHDDVRPANGLAPASATMMPHVAAADQPNAPMRTIKPSSSRVGDNYQVSPDSLPAAASAKPAPPVSDEVLFDPDALPDGAADRLLARVSGGAADDADAWLHRLQACKGDVDAALQLPLPPARDLTAEERDAFDAALTRTGARDFAMARREMGTARPVGDLVRHYYSQWKHQAGQTGTSMQYRKWRATTAARFAAVGRHCAMCGQLDPGCEALECLRCARCLHRECVRPDPLTSASPAFRAAWMCFACAPDGGNARPPPAPGEKRPVGRPRKNLGPMTDPSRLSKNPVGRPPKQPASPADSDGDDEYRPRRYAAANAVRRSRRRNSHVRNGSRGCGRTRAGSRRGRPRRRSRLSAGGRAPSAPLSAFVLPRACTDARCAGWTAGAAS